MNARSKRGTGAAALALAASMALVGLSQGAPKADSQTTRIVKAADAFLATLTEDQRKRELFAFDDEGQRARWSNFPVTFVRRAGLSLGEMTAPQRAAAMALVASALSKRGFEKVQQIVRADEVLKQDEGNSMFGKDLYYLSILGTPSETKPWMLQFGGHHLAINLTISGEKGILTPTLTGAQPAMYVADGKTVRPLADESDRGLALLNALDDAQRRQAILGYRVSDLVLGPGRDGKTIVPEGLRASAMGTKQRALLLDAISAWVGIVHDDAAKARMKEIEAGLDDTWFAWSGPATAKAGENIAAYYRIQGPKLVIEYAPQQMGGNPAMHVHTIYRDPTDDYGRGPAAK